MFRFAAGKLAPRLAKGTSLPLPALFGGLTSLSPSMPAYSFGRRGFADVSGNDSNVCAILGAQWGDEGKGKLVDILAKKYDIVARFNGGANAGHTLVVDGKKFAFHLLPCGMLYEGKVNVIGNGVVLHTPTLLKELQNLHDANIDTTGRLKISDRAHLLFDFYQTIDGLREKALGDANIGTTKKGIGPCYAAKATRHGVRVGELMEDFDAFEVRYRGLLADLQSMYEFEHDAEEELARYKQYREILSPLVIDTVQYVNQAHRDGKKILTEGANAALLDIDFGTYPFVTSSPTTAGGISTGLGMAPSKVETTIGIVKAYTTRVGSGPFPTELECAVGQKLRDVGHEYGTTTGRPRRCGWLDLPVVMFSHMVNNYSSINITKLDVLDDLDEVKIGVAYTVDGERLPYGSMPSTLKGLASVRVEYESMKGWKTDISKITDYNDLPVEAKAYLARIEELLEVPVSWVGTGPGREAMILKP